MIFFREKQWQKQWCPFQEGNNGTLKMNSTVTPPRFAQQRHGVLSRHSPSSWPRHLAMPPPAPGKILVMYGCHLGMPACTHGQALDLCTCVGGSRSHTDAFQRFDMGGMCYSLASTTRCTSEVPTRAGQPHVKPPPGVQMPHQPCMLARRPRAHATPAAATRCQPEEPGLDCIQRVSEAHAHHRRQLKSSSPATQIQVSRLYSRRHPPPKLSPQ